VEVKALEKCYTVCTRLEGYSVKARGCVKSENLKSQKMKKVKVYKDELGNFRWRQ
jgi:hypothetical protein